jgi:hypothetical protein
MIIEEFHPEEMQAFATRGPADEGSMQFPMSARSLPAFAKERGTQNLNCYSPRSGPPARNHAIERILEVKEPGYFSDVAPRGLAG